MEQSITITPTIKVTLPPGKVLVDEAEYEKLLRERLYRQWSMGDLREACQGKAEWWIRQELLVKYQKQLDADNGGFVLYPASKGQPWRMDAHKMSKWLTEHWTELDWTAKQKGV